MRLSYMISQPVWRVSTGCDGVSRRRCGHLFTTYVQNTFRVLLTRKRAIM